MSGLGTASVAEELVPGSVEASYEVAHLADGRQSVAGATAEALGKRLQIEGWAGQGAEAYAARMTAVSRRWSEIADGVGAIVEPMRTYALALRKAQTLAAEAIEGWAFAASLPQKPGDITPFTSLAQGWPVFISDPRHDGAAPTTSADARARAQAMLADARADVLAAGAVAAAAVRAAVEAVRARGATWAAVGEELGTATLTWDRVLSVMQALDGPALTALLHARPDLITRLSQIAPNEVAPWWRMLSQAQQAALIAAAPGVIGNLGGVAYAARDRANRIVLADALGKLRNAGWVDVEQLTALEALDRASSGNTLVSLVVDRPPLAQVAVGDVDAAEHVTLIVPGMGTTVRNDIESYVRFASAYAADQAQLAHVDPASIGVIAWVGYHPPMPDSHALEVAGDARAMVGASALAHDLQALRSVAAAHAGTDLSVIAHSYGTDVATLALTRADADYLVLLGSAGIAGQIGSAADLNVPEGHVFASQARLDGWAPLGQALSHRTDPTSPEFGARVFSSEAARVDGRELLAVGEHGPFGAGSQLKASYLTSNTTAMYNAALATMGHEERLVMGGTPEDRVIRNGDKWEAGPF